jgi:hypothetical protein
VILRTDIGVDYILYEVRVSFDGSGFEEGENEVCVWDTEVTLGKDLLHRTGGLLCKEAARMQQHVADKWVRALQGDTDEDQA